jgi:mono/diheme cytochrome c family protein
MIMERTAYIDSHTSGRRPAVNRPASIASTGLIASLALLTTFAFAECVRAGEKDKQVERGKYLVTIAACHDCHTPLKVGPDGVAAPDMDRQLSGHPEANGVPPEPKSTAPWDTQIYGMTAWTGFWGRSFTANLTPDPETGLGKWTLRNFVDTIRSGRHLGRGRPLQPPMPWQMYRNMTDEDLEAVFAYLQSIPPVRNRVPEPMPPSQATAATSP